MPGISVITITAGPLPATKTRLVLPRKVSCRARSRRARRTDWGRVPESACAHPITRTPGTSPGLECALSRRRPRMPAPLDGVRVLEVANWLAAPAATALMADLGAEVLKVEPPGGDVFRGFRMNSMGYTHEFAGNYAFECDNRGKRSVTVSLDRPGGPELVRRLAQTSGRVPHEPRPAALRALRAHLRGRARRESAHHLHVVQRLRRARPGSRAAGLRLRRVLGALGHHGSARRAALAAAALPRRPGRPHDRAEHPRRGARGAARARPDAARASTSR